MTTARKPPVGRFYDLQQEVKIPEDYVLTAKIRIKPLTKKQMAAFRLSDAGEDADRAFFGDNYDAISELYDDRPEQEWMAFVADVYQHFFGPGVDDQGKSEKSSES
jgi:hypothetical protein